MPSLLAGALIPALLLRATPAEAAPGEIRKANQDAIGVSRVPQLTEGVENRGAGFAGKGGPTPAGGLATGDAGRKAVKLAYGYQEKASVLGPSGANGNSGKNGFYGGGESEEEKAKIMNNKSSINPWKRMVDGTAGYNTEVKNPGSCGNQPSC